MTKRQNQKTAMSNLLDGLTAQNESLQPSVIVNDENEEIEAPSQKISRTSISARVNVDLLNKTRYIAEKERISISDVINAGLTLAIKNYESTHGPIVLRRQHLKKGNVESIFNL